MNENQWSAKDLRVRAYAVESDDLAKEDVRIRLVVQVNGKTEIDITNTQEQFEPGLVAFLSLPTEKGIRVTKIVPAPRGAVTDGPEVAIPGWALEALGIPRA